jgi:hypothetical protein
MEILIIINTMVSVLINENQKHFPKSCCQMVASNSNPFLEGFLHVDQGLIHIKLPFISKV